MITITAILSGIVKIASKMGISTIQSYQGAKIFEAIGINKKNLLTDILQIQSAVLAASAIEEIAQDYLARHSSGI